MWTVSMREFESITSRCKFLLRELNIRQETFHLQVGVAIRKPYNIKENSPHVTEISAKLQQTLAFAI